MPKLAEVPLGVVVDVLGPTFRSLDVRAIAVRLSPDEPQWRLVAGICSASRATPDDVLALHQEFLTQCKPPETDRFKILFHVLSARDHLSGFLNDIDEGSITIDGIVVDLNDRDKGEQPWRPIRDQRMQGNTRLLHPSEGGLFRVYNYFLQTTANANELLAQAVGDPYQLGLAAWSDLNLWLKETRYFERYGPQNSPTGLELLLPIYAALRNEPTVRDRKFVITAVAHGALQPQLYAQGWIRRDSSDPTPRASGPLEIPSVHKADDLNEFTVAMSFDPQRLEDRNSIEIGLFHRTLGQVHDPATIPYNMLKAPTPDLLLSALQLFEGGKNLSAYLGDRRSQSQTDLAPFEAGVVWLFCLLEIRCVPLLIYRKGEEIREERTLVGSADLLAFDRELGLIVIDCTRSVPDNPKIDRLRNTALLLSEQLGHPVHAVIVTPTDLVALPQESARYGVAFFDIHQIRSLWDLIQAQNLSLARKRLLTLIRDVPALGSA